jgi:pimeloyl-ACP methyl ester carboxylesterase
LTIKNARGLLKVVATFWLLTTITCEATLAGAVEAVRSDNDHFVLAERARLHYVESGSGRPVVLLHGNDGTLQDFTMSIFDKVAAKYHTIAFDRPGHGLSENPIHTVATPEYQARMLHSALEELGITNPLLVAHSWSGSLALSYALQFPQDLSGLVLIGGMAYETKAGSAKPIYYLAQVPVVGTILGTIYKKVGKHGIAQELAQAFSPDKAPQPYVQRFLTSMFRLSQLKAAARDEVCLNPALRKMSPQYKTIKVPLVILTGAADHIVSPQDHSYRLHETIPSSKLIVLANAGHELQFTRGENVLKAIDLAAQMAPYTAPAAPIVGSLTSPTSSLTGRPN